MLIDTQPYHNHTVNTWLLVLLHTVKTMTIYIMSDRKFDYYLKVYHSIHIDLFLVVFKAFG